MSVYRRGAVYWWHRQVSLGELSPHPIKLRMSLKTSEKAEARTRAIALDTELEMVALAYPKRNSGATWEQLETVFREALEYKRDQIADRQSRPPFDIEEHQLINAAMARIYGLLARTGSLDVSAAQWERACSDPVMSDRELATFLGFAREYRFQSPTAERRASSAGDDAYDLGQK